MLRVTGFDSRFSGRFPTGYIMFSDRTRITYSSLLGPDTARPGTTRDEWGLNPDWEDQGVSEVHLRLARAYVDQHLVRPAVAVPQYRAEQAAREAQRTAIKSNA
jgi:hypothetical protein